MKTTQTQLIRLISRQNSKDKIKWFKSDESFMIDIKTATKTPSIIVKYSTHIITTDKIVIYTYRCNISTIGFKGRQMLMQMS